MARPRLIALALALITLVIYLPARQFEFSVFDDDDYVTDNYMVQRGLSAEGLRWAFTTFHASNWHPLTWLSHMLDCQLFGVNAGAHHLVNVLFHVANAVLLFWLIVLIGRKVWPAAVVAALFAWHPLHVESVAWIAERKDVLSTFFGLLSLLAYARYARQIKSPGYGGKLFFAAALVTFALALMAKPMMVTLPFLMLLLDFWPLSRGQPGAGCVRSWSRLFIEKTPFFLLTLGSCIVTFLAQRAQAVQSMHHVEIALRLENAVTAYCTYLAKTLFPVHLAIFYPLTRPPFATWMAALVLLVVLSLLVWRAGNSKPYLLMGWLWFLGTLVPVIGLVQVGGQAMADRYTYFPLVGLFIMAAFWAHESFERGKRPGWQVVAVAAVLCCGCLAATVHQLAYWHDSERLFRHSLAVTPDNAPARINLGVALEHEGSTNEALAQYERALELEPARAQIHNNIAELLDGMDRTNEALIHYREALRLMPESPVIRMNLGTLLVKMGDHDEAMREYERASHFMPSDPRPAYLMGKAELKRGDERAAVGHFREALRLDPKNIQALVFLSRTLSSAQDPTVRNPAEALQLAERANDLAGGGDPFVFDTLAMAQKANGQSAETNVPGTPSSDGSNKSEQPLKR